MMDAYEATRIVFSRIQALDPENASKIMGLLLIQDHGDKEMIRLAFGPEALLQSLVVKARKDLGLSPATTPSTPPSPSPFLSASRLHSIGLPSPLSVTPSPALPPSSWSPDELLSPASAAFYPAAAASGDRIDDFQLQDQLSFLNDAGIGPKPAGDVFYPEMEARSPTGAVDGGIVFPYSNWVNGGHRRGCSVADICLGSDPTGAGFGWKPCLYYARGYCKNGTSCRFLHGLPDPDPIGSAKLDVVDQCQDLLRSKSQRLSVTAAHSQLLSPSSFPYNAAAAAGKCMNFLLPPHQQSDSQRLILTDAELNLNRAAAAALMLGGEDAHKFGGRLRMERGEFGAPGTGMVNPGSRQIYLTFPADSTFREEDVSNYFSIYGPVQDVRIPYQQKRMFGFVTFVYPETVRLILAKGNPHFVCDARVLVKPYKEKGKVPDKYRKQQQPERGDLSSCTTPSSIDSYDLQLGARMFHNSHDALRRKLEERVDLQQAIEMQGRRLMNLQLLDVKKWSTSSPLPSPSPSPSDQFHHSAFPSGRSSPEAPEEKNSSSAAEATHLQQLSHDPFGQQNDKECSGICAAAVTIAAEESPKEDSDFQESSILEHNLPDSPFASPTKSVAETLSIFSETAPNNNSLTASSPFPTTSTLDMPSFKSCFFQMPRFSSGHGAIGM